MKHIQALVLYMVVIVTMFYVAKWIDLDFTLTIALVGLYLG